MSGATTPISGRGRAAARRYRPGLRLATKAALVGLIFIIVPVILYFQFGAADREKRDLLNTSVRAQGSTVATALAPLLTADGAPPLPVIGRELQRYANPLTTIKLLFRPAGSGPDSFYYVASSAPLSNDALDAERQSLTQQGILSRLNESCGGDVAISLRYRAPDGHDEIVNSVVPVQTASGCWAVVTSLSAAQVPELALDRPYYALPEVHLAALIYLLMALVTFTTFFSIWRGLGRFAEQARRIRSHSPGAPSFVARTTVPELAGVAAEFDRMVATLQNSAQEIRQAAEDNAHAFKTPIAIIRQSLEPVARAVPVDHARAHRALGLIERSLDKLDGLVASSRRLGEATADLLDTPRVEFDLADLVEQLLAAQGERLRDHAVMLEANLARPVPIRANAEMLETVIENLLDNALSFSRPGGRIEIRLAASGYWAELTIADTGPGVSPANLPRIFERYFSVRPSQGDTLDAESHFGVGLWIVRRNIEALGGAVSAENREADGKIQGFSIRISLPIRRMLGQKGPSWPEAAQQL